MEAACSSETLVCYTFSIFSILTADRLASTSLIFKKEVSCYYEVLVRLYETLVSQGRTTYHIMKNRYLFISKATRNMHVYVLLHSVLIVNVWVLLP